MKKWIHSSENADRITIDFYYIIDQPDEIAASKKQKSRVFKNVDRVIEEVKKHIENKGLTVLNCHKSNRIESDSTYYDVDVKVETNKGNLEFVYFRIADHFISANTTQEQVENYYANQTRKYKGLPDSEDVTVLFDAYSIVVIGKRFTNFDLAMNKVKEEIDIYLKDKKII